MRLNGKNVHPAFLITLGATVKDFTSTDFLGPIRFDFPNGGTSNSRKKKTWTLPLIITEQFTATY